MLVPQVTGNNVQALAVTHRLIKKIKDERFDEEALHEYQLFLHIGVRDFQVLIVDEKNKVLLLEDYVLPDVSSQDSLNKTLIDLFDSHAVLKAGFWKAVKISLKTVKFVQVPLALFSQESMNEYLLFNAQIDEKKETILKTEHPHYEAVTVFAVNTYLHDWLLKVYRSTTVTVMHQAAALIEGVLAVSGKSTGPSPLYIYVDRFKLHIIACQAGKLLYYNQFSIKHFQDYVRYIMMVMKSLNMNQQSSKVVLWGYIGKNSPHYHEFYKYINNVSFGGKPESLRFSYLFDEVPEHSFFDLYSMQLVGA
jgi:hypothetical protein